MYKHLAPGGWFEISEQEQDMRSDDGTIENSTLRKWFDIYRSLAPKAGLQFVDENELVQLAKDAGFVDVSVKTIKMPQGPWPKDKKMKEVGKICTMVVSTGFDSHGLALFTKYGNMSTEEAKTLSQGAFADVVGRKVHAYCRRELRISGWFWMFADAGLVHHIIGRKPEKTE